jgi:hypothetical protein
MESAHISPTIDELTPADSTTIARLTGQCRICLATGAELAQTLTVLFRLDPAVVAAAVMAEPDLCIGCCLDLGRAEWMNRKARLAETHWAAEFVKAAIERMRKVYA